MKQLFMILAMAVVSVTAANAQEEPKQVGEKVETKACCNALTRKNVLINKNVKKTKKSVLQKERKNLVAKKKLKNQNRLKLNF